ncbi:MAG: hypothetical protein ACRD0N_01975 [Acidimicrobiales bacterium]
MTAAVTTPEIDRIGPEPLPPRVTPRSPVRPLTAWFFFVLLCYQGFHQLEHAIETVQLQLLHHSESHTLLRGVDFEYVHFGANLLLLYGLFAVVVGAGTAARRRWRTERRWGWGFMCTALVVQSYHVFDHLVRLIEYIQTSGEVPEGTVTHWVNPVWFHFFMNLSVFLGMLAAFIGLRVHRALWQPPEIVNPGPP